MFVRFLSIKINPSNLQQVNRSIVPITSFLLILLDLYFNIILFLNVLQQQKNKLITVKKGGGLR